MALAMSRRTLSMNFICSRAIVRTPPGFRPPMLEYAVQKNKHIFTEKPVAVDPVGVKHVMETCEMAKKKGAKTPPKKTATKTVKKKAPKLKLTGPKNKPVTVVIA